MRGTTVFNHLAMIHYLAGFLICKNECNYLTLILNIQVTNFLWHLFLHVFVNRLCSSRVGLYVSHGFRPQDPELSMLDNYRIYRIFLHLLHLSQFIAIRLIAINDSYRIEIFFRIYRNTISQKNHLSNMLTPNVSRQLYH